MNTQNSNTLTYVNSAMDTMPKALTREKFSELLDSKATKMLLHNYRTTGHEQSKRSLPAVLFNGVVSPEQTNLYMTQPAAPGQKRRTRRDAACYVPSTLLGLDMDPDEGCQMSAREQFQLTWQRVKDAFGTEPEQLIAMAYETPTRPGWRMVVRRTPGLAIHEEHALWNRILPTPCDGKKPAEMDSQIGPIV